MHRRWQKQVRPILRAGTGWAGIPGSRPRHRPGCHVLLLDRHGEYISAAAMAVDMRRDEPG